MSRSTEDRLHDILRAIEAISTAEALARQHQDEASTTQVADVALAAVQFHVVTIGEAVKALPADVTSARPEVPWSQIARMRDLIAHRYYALDTAIVRATIGTPLAQLRAACQALLRDA